MSPSSAETPATLSVTRSSLSIVPVAVAVPSTALADTPDSVTVKVSFTSTVSSCTVATVIVASVSPASISTVPVLVDPRSPRTAVSPLPIDAVQVAVTSASASVDSVTAKVTGLPSVAAASATLSLGRVPSLIVPVAVVSVPSVAFCGFEIVSVKVSSSSSASSSVAATSIVPVPAPASMVSVPLAAVKSVSETADWGLASDVA